MKKGEWEMVQRMRAHHDQVLTALSATIDQMKEEDVAYFLFFLETQMAKGKRGCGSLQATESFVAMAALVGLIHAVLSGSDIAEDA